MHEPGNGSAGPADSQAGAGAIGAAAFVAADGWRGRDDVRLARDGKGLPLPVVDNVVKILLNDTDWAGVLAYNEFSGMVMKREAPPFSPTEPGEWTDLDDARLELWMAEHYGIRRLPESAIQRGVMLAADQNRFHEVREFLEGLTWDGTPRLAHWLFLYLGAPESDYTRLAGAKYLIGAVARIMRSPAPVKVDNVLILEGPQGAGKSSALKTLFSPWFTDAAFEIGSTDGYQIIRGMWGVELAELDGLNRAEASRSKAFFTREVDRYRNPYGRKPVNVVRQCVFSGSVNHATYLKDDSGNRRFLPVTCGYIALDELAADREQLWAEALAEYRKGTPWWVRAGEAGVFEEAQDERYIGDAWEDRIRSWLDDPPDAGGQRNEITSSEILQKALSIEIAKWTIADQQRVGRIMARIGWKREKRGTRVSREWVYVRPAADRRAS